MKFKSLDEARFRKILTRNLVLPLGLSLLLCGMFVALVLYLLSFGRWVDHTDQVIAHANVAEKLMIDAETGMRGYLIAGAPEFLEPYENAQKNLSQELEQLRGSLAESPAQKARLESLASRFGSWNEFARELIRVKAQGANPLDLVRSQTGKKQMDEIRREFAALRGAEEELRTERSQSATQMTTLLLIVSVAATLIFGTLLAFGGRKQLLELSHLFGDALEKQVQQNEILESRDWLKSGQNALSANTRGDLQLEKLCAEALAFLANYLGALAGVIYVRRDSGEFKRKAGFGLSAERMGRQETFLVGERLAGQCAQQGKLIHLTDVPEGYLSISSGLGEANSREIAIAPLMVNQRTIAVVELGTYKGFSGLHLEFLGAISESLGISIQTARYRQNLESLLSETQRQAEALQTQQEELRVTNEELETQAKALKDSQTRLESQQQELEISNSQLQEQKENLDRRNRELRKFQLDLQRNARELESANRYKSEFLANMSHELRTPLNSSLILTKLLLENKTKNLNDEQRKFLETISASSHDLLTLINDVLDLSKVEAGKLEIQPETFELDDMLESLSRIFQPLASEKKLSLRLERDSKVPGSMDTDRLRLEQVLRNFLSNALKFTSRGEVSLKISSTEGSGGGDLLAFSVRDTGIGIPEAQQELIFEAFRQADGATNRKYGGTGLGLSISRDLARLLGGEIRLESRAGEGSVFTLLIPRKYGSGPSLPAPTEEKSDSSRTVDRVMEPTQEGAAPASEGPRIQPAFEDDRANLDPKRKTLLVIEDESKFSKVLFELVREQGFQGLVAHSAEDGIELAQKFPVDGILLDLGLPDHNGLTVLDRLKVNAKTRHIPIHVVSGANDQRAALEMGAIGFLQKPAEANALRSALAALGEKAAQQVKQLLIVEDDAIQRDAIQRLIGGGDVRIVAVETGREALEQLRTSVFDCMITDLKLPDMSGEELLDEMSKEHEGSFPPVIVYTARSLTREEETRLLMRSRTIVVKGAHSPERLLNEVTLFLHRVESGLSQERQTMLRDFRSREKVFEGRRILLVDDDVRNIFALTSALESRGAKILAARNGKEALRVLEGNDKVDLVLMDVMMPEMDGYTAMKEIRKQPKLARLPIIAVTARAMRDDQERAIQAGANDYLAKPIDLEKLLSLIRVWIPKAN